MRATDLHHGKGAAENRNAQSTRDNKLYKECLLVKNIDIRTALLVGNIRNYQVAEALNVTEFTFSRWLRQDLQPERKQVIMTAIEKLTNGKQ